MACKAIFTCVLCGGLNVPPKMPIFILLFYYIFTNFTIKTKKNVNNTYMAKVLNSLLSTIMIFLLTFTWAYYCIKNVTWALALSATVSVCACYLLWKSLSKWDDGKRLKNSKKAIADFAEYLKFGEDNASLFEDMLKYYGFEVFKTDYDSLDAVKTESKVTRLSISNKTPYRKTRYVTRLSTQKKKSGKTVRFYL